jgi:hypothetical protein
MSTRSQAGPHADFSFEDNSHRPEFTVAARSTPFYQTSSAAIVSTNLTSSLVSDGMLNMKAAKQYSASQAVAIATEQDAEISDVRFATRNMSNGRGLAEMTPAELRSAPSLSLASSEPSTSQSKRDDYPYWVVALIQIVIGTIFVILVVKFATLIRESTESPSRQVLVPTPSDEPAPSVISQVSWLGNSQTSTSSLQSPANGF